MTKIIGKVIYIPSTYEGKRYGYPEIIYVRNYLLNDVQGSRIPEEVDEGRYSHYKKSRCIPYSDDVWDECQSHIRNKELVDDNYKRLEKVARRKSNQRKLSLRV